MTSKDIAIHFEHQNTWYHDVYFAKDLDIKPSAEFKAMVRNVKRLNRLRLKTIAKKIQRISNASNETINDN